MTYGRRNTNRLCAGLLLLLLGVFYSRCSSTVGAGQVRADRASGQIDEVREAIVASAIPEAQKKKLIENLNAIQKTTVDLGHDVDANKEIADKFEDDSDTLSRIYWAGGIAGAALFFFLIRGFISRILSGGIAKA